MVAHLHLSWKSSEENLMSSLSTHATKSIFSDLNLVCKDSERVSAHQVILSSSSPFLKTLLLQHMENVTGERPTIIIPDVAREDLEALLEFLYQGTLKLGEIQYQKFIHLTKNLGVKNLKKQQKGSVRKVGKSIKKPSVKPENMMSLPSTSRDIMKKEEYERIGNNEHFDDSDNIFNDIDEEDHLDDDDHVEKSEEKENPGIEVKNESQSKTKLESDAEKAKIRYKSLFGTFLCPHCAQIFTLKKSLKYHIQNIHEGIRYQCDQCPYQATNKAGLKRHVECHHEGFVFYCDQCDHKYTSKSSLNTHIQTQHSDLIWKCDDCDYKTKQKPNLKKHRDAKHDNIRYNCEICSKSLSQKGQLKVHMKKFHGIDRRTYQTVNVLNHT